MKATKSVLSEILNKLVNKMESVRSDCWESFKNIFNQKISEFESTEFTIKDEHHYNKIISDVQTSKLKLKKDAKDYRRLKRFEVMKIGGVTKLILPPEDGCEINVENIKVYVHNDELFDILRSAHIDIGHGGLHRMYDIIHKKYHNVQRKIIQLFLNHCEICQRKKSFPKKGVVVKPLLFNRVGARGQVDLIDMQSCKDKNYKFILNYQDHLSKFVLLRPLETKSAPEVAYVLVDLFCIFGCPEILQSDNGREFVNSIINELSSLWPGLKIVHGKPRHSQSQGSVERSNRDVEDILRAWMTENNTSRWSEGLRFVQFQKNNGLHTAIKQSPYHAMFGREAKIGLKNSAIPPEIFASLHTEDDVLEAVNDSSNVDDLLSPEADVIAETHNSIKRSHELAFQGLEQQAKKMKFASDCKFRALTKGMSVLLPVPDVDKSKADSRNLIGMLQKYYCFSYSLNIIL